MSDDAFNPAYRVARCGQQSAHDGPHVVEHGPDQPRNCPGTGGQGPVDWSKLCKCPVCQAEIGEPCTSLTGYYADKPGQPVAVKAPGPHASRKPRAVKS